MEHDAFIGQVQNRARLSSRGDAERAVRATLETLAERLTSDEASNLAAQLPSEIGRHLRREGEPLRLSLDDFFNRVSEREGIDLPIAVHHARVVIEVLQEAVSKGEIDDVRSQLPAEFDRLFEAGSEGRMPPEP